MEIFVGLCDELVFPVLNASRSFLRNSRKDNAEFIFVLVFKGKDSQVM